MGRALTPPSLESEHPPECLRLTLGEPVESKVMLPLVTATAVLNRKVALEGIKKRKRMVSKTLREKANDEVVCGGKVGN